MKVVFVFAHPDDESFSSGGTIAKLVQGGVTVKLITATRGEAGSVGNPPLCQLKELGKVREKELRTAAKILGIVEIYFLDFIDGTLKKIPLAKITKKILAILEKEKPDAVITFNIDGGSRHPDHIRISQAATQAFKKYQITAQKHVRLYHTAMPQSLIKKYQKLGFEYRAFGKIPGTPDEEITTAININKTFKTKIKAVMSHQTQHQDWERFLKRSQKLNLKTEYFQLIRENSI